MTEKEFSWKTIDDIELYGKYWATEGHVDAVVCLVHGMGEHCNRYAHLGKFLAEDHIALIGFDHRGHGKSGGKRGHTPSYDHLLQGVDELVDKAMEFFPETPIFLYGHSMGGNLVLNYALQRKPQINGVIASSPWIKLAFDPPKIQVKMGKLVNKIYPAFTQSTNLDTKAISRIEEEVKKYEEDPLVHDNISTMFFLSAYEQGLWALKHAGEFTLPLLIYHGTGDQLTSYKATEAFANKVNNDVTFKLFEGAFHEIHNDLDQKELFELMKSWIRSHL